MQDALNASFSLWTVAIDQPMYIRAPALIYRIQRQKYCYRSVEQILEVLCDMQQG